MLFQKKSGEYAGVEALRLLNHKSEKTKKLTLGDHHCRTDEGQFDMVDFASDEFSIVKLYKHIERHFMPEEKYGVDVGRFFCRRAAEKVLKKRRKDNAGFTVGIHPNDVWSTKYFSDQMKALAIRCSFANATRCTGQGKRAEGVSRLVNSKEIIPLCESMRASRHNSVDAHLGYTEADEEAHGKRYRAMGVKTNSFMDKKCKVAKSDTGDAPAATTVNALAMANAQTDAAPAARVNALGMGGMAGMGMGGMGMAGMGMGVNGMNTMMQQSMLLQINMQMQMLQQQQQQTMMSMGMGGMNTGLGVATNAEPYMSVEAQDPNLENVGGAKITFE